MREENKINYKFYKFNTSLNHVKEKHYGGSIFNSEIKGFLKKGEASFRLSRLMG